MKFSLAVLLGLTMACSSMVTREKLADKKALAEHVEDNIKFGGDAELYQGKHQLKTLGIISMHCSHIIQDTLTNSSSKHIANNRVKTTTSTLSAEISNENLATVCNMTEEEFAKKLEGMGYTVKRIVEMKQFPSYGKIGSPHQGVSTSGIQRLTIAQDGQNYIGSMPSFSTDEEWANALAKEAGVDALVWAMSAASWGLEGKTKRDGMEGVTFRVDPKTMFHVVIPYDKCKAAGGCGGWIEHNGAIQTNQDFNYTLQLFMPGEDSEKGQQGILDFWTRYADEQAFLLGMHMMKFEQEMKD